MLILVLRAWLATHEPVTWLEVRDGVTYVHECGVYGPGAGLSCTLTPAEEMY